jgi:hypothetical protein
MKTIIFKRRIEAGFGTYCGIKGTKKEFDGVGVNRGQVMGRLKKG